MPFRFQYLRLLLLVPQTPTKFDNQYFKLLLEGGGAFFSDRTLVEDPETRAIVEKYARDQSAFFKVSCVVGYAPCVLRVRPLSLRGTIPLM